MPDHCDEQRGAAYLLYDADCGPCTRFKNIIVRLDPKHRLIPIPLQSGTAYELVRSEMTRAEMMRAVHIVYSTSRSIEPTGERGRVFNAGDALIQLIRLLPLGSYAYWVAVHFRPFRTLIRWLYYRVAELRAISLSCKVSP